MKRWTPLLFSAALVVPAPAFAQDPVKVDGGHYNVVLDNPSVRVLKVDHPAGGKSPMHDHPDAIIVALSAAKVRFTLPDGKSEESSLANDSAMYTPAGKHSPANIGTSAVSALVIEFKGAAPGKAALPAARAGLATKVLAEGPRGSASRTTASPTFHEPAGSTHDFDQVVIALAPMQMSLAIDGKPARTSWVRGDVAFIGRGVPHEAKNTSGKPADFIIIAVK